MRAPLIHRSCTSLECSDAPRDGPFLLIRQRLHLHDHEVFRNALESKDIKLTSPRKTTLLHKYVASLHVFPLFTIVFSYAS